MTCPQLLNAVTQHQRLTEQRLQPMRMAVTQYAAMLGMEPAACLSAVYDLADRQLTALVQTHARAHWNRRTRSTFANQVQWLLRLGRKQGWLEPRDTLLKRGRDHRDGPQKGWVPRHELPPKLIDRLQPMPESLEQEMQTSLQWCRRVAQPGRPHSVKQRATTCQAVSEALTRLAGCAVHDQQLPEALLTVRDLCDPARVHAFIQWWVEERRRKLTHGLRNMVANLEVIARHWL
jgi:hypothetical protein